MAHFNDFVNHDDSVANNHWFVSAKLWDSFIAMLEYYYEDVVRDFDRELSKGFLSYEAAIFFLNRTDSAVIQKRPDDPKACVLLNASSKQRMILSKSMENYCANFTGYSYKHNGRFFERTTKSCSIYQDTKQSLIKKPWIEWLIWPTSDKELKWMQKRGEKYASSAQEPKHMHYKGEMQCRVGFWHTSINLNSRVVIDVKNYHNQDALDNNQNNNVKQQDLEAGCYLKLPSKYYLYCHPMIEGFSLKTKQWGTMNVDDLEPVTYDSMAYEYLVLEQKKKKVIRCFVEDHFTAEGTEMDKANTNSPIVLQKSQGKIFLLQGPCGTGKTLTAEAISDLVQCPLYSIAVGELGCDPIAMEKKLSQVLNLATQWKAVVLIDEADIFLERRTTSDIQRNALVGIFLRVLEYYRGILFLTTNRIESFDEAFFSRCSVNLHYPELNFESRRSVLRSIIKQMKLNEEGLINAEVDEALQRFALNGRTIKTALSLAKTLAISSGSVMTSEHLLQTLELVSHSTTNASVELM